MYTLSWDTPWWPTAAAALLLHCCQVMICLEMAFVWVATVFSQFRLSSVFLMRAWHIVHPKEHVPKITFIFGHKREFSREQKKTSRALHPVYTRSFKLSRNKMLVTWIILVWWIILSGAYRRRALEVKTMMHLTRWRVLSSPVIV